MSAEVDEYAMQIARSRNVKSDGCGYVLRFAVNPEFLARYTIQQVGNGTHLTGPIEIIASFS
jgi:hypothetical protein